MDRREEEKIIEDLEKKRQRISNMKLKKEIKHFRFSEFAQTIIGVGVFGLPAIINTSFWNYLPNITLESLFYIHLFFLFCSVIGKNYQFRSDLPLNDRWFMIMFSKHVVYMYISVMIATFLLLPFVGQLSMDMTMHDFLKNFLAAQSVGIMGAVTFTFFKKDD